MTPHTQMRLHVEGEQNGDCWATDIECVLDLPLGTLPRWEIEGDWGTYWYSVQAWLYHHRGLMVTQVSYWQFPALQITGYHLISGRSPRRPDDEQYFHAVVGHEGRVAHDPHPSRAGVLDIQAWELITPVPDDMRSQRRWWPVGLACPCGCTPAAQEAAA